MTLLVGILLAVVLVMGRKVLAILTGPAPPEAPPEKAAEDLKRRERLFQPRPWRRRQLAAVKPRALDAQSFHRPLEIQPLPDQQILPPPRDVRGVNREDED
jgi:hypothetical protein